jgi:hypothetical protein
VLCILSLFGLGGVGGCLTRLGRDLPVTETDRSTTGLPRALDTMPDSDPFGVLAVGDRQFVPPPRAEPHSIRVWNDSSSRRLVSLKLVVGSSNTVFSRDVEFPAGGVFAVDLVEPASYRLVLGSDADEHAVDVDAAQFDCNSSATDVAVRADWSVDERTISTTMGCGPLS